MAEIFVSKLKVLNIPGADELCSAELEWVFCCPDVEPLALFLTWLANNISYGDILTEEEIQRFDEIKEEQLYSSEQLKTMENLFAKVNLEEEFLNRKVECDFENIKKCNELLTYRCNLLNCQKFEVKEEIKNIEDHNALLENELSNYQSAMLENCSHLAETLQSLSYLIRTQMDELKTFYEKTSYSESSYLSQLDLKDWFTEEEVYDDLLRIYIDKQLNSGINDLAGSTDPSEYCILDAYNLDSQLVKGAGQTQYLQDVVELSRLIKELELEECNKVEAEISLAGKRSEIEEIKKYMDSHYRSNVPETLPLLRKKLKSVEVSKNLLELELQRETVLALDLARHASKNDSTKTISGDYLLKIQRQEYLLSKHDVFEYTYIVCYINLLKDISSGLSDIQINHAEVASSLKAILSKWDQFNDINFLPSSLSIFSDLFSTDNDHLCQPSSLVNKIKAFNAELLESEDSLKAYQHPFNMALKKQKETVSVLETLLFGRPGIFTMIPGAWINSDLTDRQSIVEEDTWKLKQLMLELFQYYETRKNK